MRRGHSSLQVWDQIRVRLSEDGFIPRDADGYASANGVRNLVLDTLHQGEIGRVGDTSVVGGDFGWRHACTSANFNPHQRVCGSTSRMAPASYLSFTQK